MKKIIFICCSVFLIFENIVATDIPFTAHTVATNLSKASAIYVEDINKDGYQDLITTAAGNKGEVSWWQNDGNQQFIKHVISSNFASARSVVVADINNDGELDIIATARLANRVTWWKNDGNENFEEIDVDSDFLGAHTVDIKDINNDGFVDILCSGFDLNGNNTEVAWWENNSSQAFTKHVVANKYQKTAFVEGAYIDNDEYMDILVCDEKTGDVVWFKNDGSNNFPNELVIDSKYPFAHTVFARDLDNDGDKDILGTATGQSNFTWWENDGNLSFTKHHIAKMTGAIWIDMIDIDNDGDNDLIGAAMGETSVSWWENDGSQNFTKHKVPGSCPGGFGMVAKDIDGDNDIDFAAVGYSSNKLVWWENTSAATSVGNSEFPIKSFKLKQNYPNPFNPETTIEYVTDEVAEINITIFNSIGEKVAVLLNEFKKAGCYNVRFNAEKLPSGTYFCKMGSGQNRQVIKMTLLK